MVFRGAIHVWKPYDRAICSAGARPSVSPERSAMDQRQSAQAIVCEWFPQAEVRPILKVDELGQEAASEPARYAVFDQSGPDASILATGSTEEEAWDYAAGVKRGRSAPQ